jgi:hypothetical protein
VQILAPEPQIHECIPNQLSWTMIGGLAAAVGFHNGVWERSLLPAQTGAVRAAPNRVDGFMLQKQQLVGLLKVFDLCRENLFLNPKPLSVLNAPEPPGL